jgi:hypothetical protein
MGTKQAIRVEVKSTGLSTWCAAKFNIPVTVQGHNSHKRDFIAYQNWAVKYRHHHGRILSFVRRILACPLRGKLNCKLPLRTEHGL